MYESMQVECNDKIHMFALSLALSDLVIDLHHVLPLSNDDLKGHSTLMDYWECFMRS